MLTELKSLELLKKKLAAKHEVKAVDHGDPTAPIDVDDLLWLSEALTETIHQRMALQHDVASKFAAIPSRDLPIARMVKEILGERVLFIGKGDHREMYLWNGTYFELAPEGEFTGEERLLWAIADGVITPLKGYITEVLRTDWGDSVLNQTVGSAMGQALARVGSYEDSYGQSGLVKLVRAVHGAPVGTFDSNRYFVYNNGIWDSESDGYEVMPHSPEFRVTNRNRMNTELIDFSEHYDVNDFSTIGAPNVEKYVAHSVQTREDGVNLLRLLGVALLSGAPTIRSLANLYGAPRGGKSTLTRIMKALAPDLVEEGGADHFDVNAKSTALGDLKGKRLIFSDEAENININQALTKKFAGGGTINADVKYKARTKFEVQGGLFFVSNNDEGSEVSNLFNLKDPGTYDRAFPVYFDKSFYGSEADEANPDHEADKRIEFKIIENELPQLAYILTRLMQDWRLDGYEDYVPLTDNQKRLRTLTLGENDMIDAYVKEGMQAGAFQNAKADTPNSKLLTFGAFWKGYKAWYENATHKEATRGKILSELKSRGWISESGEGRGKKVYVVGLTQEAAWAAALFNADEVNLAESQGF